MSNIKTYVNTHLPVSNSIQYLAENQVNNLTLAFQNYYDANERKAQKANRGRYWLTYLMLRYTGARIGEVLLINDITDIDFRNAEIKLTTLKKRYKNKKKRSSRIVPVPSNVVSETATYLAAYPDMRGKLFKIYQDNFRRKFYELSEEAGIPKELGHPHILRHSRAMELLKSGIPVTIVQDLLGHAALTTTAIYLRMSGQDAKNILKEKGMI